MGSELRKAGLNFIVGLTGTTLTTKERDLLRTLGPCGVIIFRYNIDANSPSWPQKLRDLLASARDAAEQETFFTSIDHEGGKVHRLLDPVTHFPEASLWTSNAEATGRAMGRELRCLGFNMNFGPVLDIHSEPTNPVIGSRALGTNPEEVKERGLDYFRGLEQEGVIACGKHFPGHGATTVDSHLALPELPLSLAELEERELIPFRHLISNGMQMLMTAHVLYPAIDPRAPATVSATILRDILRSRIGYSGVVISDALEMKALAGIEENELPSRALRSGVDILLVAQPKASVPLETAEHMASNILSALEKGEPMISDLKNARQRIIRLGEHGKRLRQKSRYTDRGDDILGCDEHRKLLAKISGTSNMDF